MRHEESDASTNKKCIKTELNIARVAIF